MKNRNPEGGTERGYKLVNKFMRSTIPISKMQYELNVLHEVENPHRQGHFFHYTRTMKNCLSRFGSNSSRIFEIEASGEIIDRPDCSGCSKIKFIREISLAEAKEMLQTEQPEAINEKLKLELSRRKNIHDFTLARRGK